MAVVEVYGALWARLGIAPGLREERPDRPHTQKLDHLSATPRPDYHNNRNGDLLLAFRV